MILDPVTDQDKLEELGKLWQTALRVTGWTVSFGFARAEASRVQGRPPSGWVDYDLPRRAAKIWLLHPADYPHDEPQDHEKTLVHELLHLPWAILDVCYKGDRVADTIIEQNFVDMSGLLVNLRRAAMTSDKIDTAEQEPAAVKARGKKRS